MDGPNASHHRDHRGLSRRATYQQAVRGRHRFVGLCITQILAHLLLLLLGSPRFHAAIARSSDLRYSPDLLTLLPSLSDMRHYSLVACVLLPLLFCPISFVMGYRNQRDLRLAAWGVAASVALAILHGSLLLLLALNL